MGYYLVRVRVLWLDTMKYYEILVRVRYETYLGLGLEVIEIMREYEKFVIVRVKGIL